MSTPPRVRFAPSPTGFFHVGGARTALFNWLFAKQSGGQFILRIEDTDEARNKEEWVEGIKSALLWLGITWDEGPYRQSDRVESYRKLAADLQTSGSAYYCDCTREEIDLRIKMAGRPPGYDGFCRDRGLDYVEGRALRFRTPDTGETVVDDLVRGPVVFENKNIEDFILMKGNGAPLFVLANVADDLDMRITHVIRAEEHLPTTPKAIMVYRALRETPPSFAHLPVLVNEKRQKLSKRRDRVAVEDFRDQGFLAVAMENYLVLLGWSPGDDREFLARDDEVELFHLDRVGHSPSFFDVTKMLHFNKHYIALMSPMELLDASRPFLDSLESWSGDPRQVEAFLALAPDLLTRVSLLSEVPDMVNFLFEHDLTIDDAILAEMRKDVGASSILSLTAEALSSLEHFDAEHLEMMAREMAEEMSLSLRKLQAPLRIAITGKKVGPPLFGAMAVLGRDMCMSRLRDLNQQLGV